MNIHHLELFYYVARYGGISEAVRNMPYGIQQPAVSGQILLLEDSLGVTLFQRRPFLLTPAGRELFAFAEPFFSRLGEIEKQVGGGTSPLVRMAASSIVLREHLPEVVRKVKVRFPNLKLVLQTSLQSDVAAALERQEIDIAVTSMDGKWPAGISHTELLRLSLVLVVPKDGGVESIDQLFACDRIEHTLIGLPPREAMSRLFQAGLARRKVSWPVGIEVNSLDLIETYVSAGFGVGVALAIPGQKWGRGVRVLELSGFDSLVMAVLWRGKLSDPNRSVVEECVAKALEIAGDPAGGLRGKPGQRSV